MHFLMNLKNVIYFVLIAIENFITYIQMKIFLMKTI
jgi:hypothetical protein